MHIGLSKRTLEPRRICVGALVISAWFVVAGTFTFATESGKAGVADEQGAIGAATAEKPESRLPRRKPTEPTVRYAAVEGPQENDFTTTTDRWRIVPPPHELNVRGSLWDPYNQNVLKGDFPIIGQDIFFNLGLIVDTLWEGNKVPTPSGVSADRPGSEDFFGDGKSFFFNNNVGLSLELFKGDTAFRPPAFRVKGTLVGNVNYLSAGENGVVNPDVRAGTTRTDGIAALQEMFGEVKLFDINDNFDFVSLRGGIQPFISDFRGFVFFDTNLGARLFGSLESNRDQYNVSYFNRLEKDTNSGLNRFESRKQEVWIANFYRQDFPVKGYTLQASVHNVHDPGGFRFNQNDFLVRPDPVGVFKEHTVNATYIGWTGQGHFGRFNLSNAFYFATGRDSRNPIAGRSVDIRAFMAAIELSYDVNWFRPKISYFYASGDSDPTDDTGTGFDSIFDNPVFAGGGASFWNRIQLGLAGTGVSLVNRGSLLPDLRSSKEEGQPNFVNPGVHIFNIGMDIEVTPKVRAILNFNYLRFDNTAPLERILFQAPIDEEIGWDFGVAVRYRPFLNENMAFIVGMTTLVPGQGFKQIYESATLFSAFTNMTLMY